jgi:hypothetical protein
VAAAVNARIYTLSSSSSDNHELNGKYKQKVEDITSPAKRSKQNAQVGSRPRSKEVLPCESCQCPLKATTEVDVRNSGKVCENCKNDAGRDRTNSDVTSQESEGAMSPLHIGSNIHEDEEPTELHSAKYNRNSEIIENGQQKRTLEAAREIINYSPESVFLQRLKERSQALGDLIALEDIKRTLAEPSSVTPPVKRGPIKTNLDNCSPSKTLHSARPSAHGGHRLTSDRNQQGTTKRSPQRSMRRTCNDGLKLKKNRKRVCYRKNCHCRVQENIRSTENFPSGMKEKAEAKLAKEVRLVF